VRNNFPLVDQLLASALSPKRACTGSREGEEGALVGGEVAHGLAERPVLRLGPARQARRIGGEKREGRSSSALFLARWKQTRPTTFQAAWRP